AGHRVGFRLGRALDGPAVDRMEAPLERALPAADRAGLFRRAAGHGSARLAGVAAQRDRRRGRGRRHRIGDRLGTPSRARTTMPTTTAPKASTAAPEPAPGNTATQGARRNQGGGGGSGGRPMHEVTHWTEDALVVDDPEALKKVDRKALSAS